MSLRAVFTSGLLYVGLATAQQTYAKNQVAVVNDDEEAVKNFPSIEDVKLESPAFTDPKSIPAGFKNGTSGPTDDATLEYFLQSLASRNDWLTYKNPAFKSDEGRSIPYVYLTTSTQPQIKANASSTEKLRVYLQGGVHGNEPGGDQALLALLGKFDANSTWTASILEKMDIMILPRYNPDGVAYFQRVLATGYDPNRDHIRFASQQTRDVKALITDFHPHIAVDAHEFGATRPFGDNKQWHQAVDGQFDAMKNLNIHKDIREYSESVFAPQIAGAMEKRKLRWSPYIVGSAAEPLVFTQLDTQARAGDVSLALTQAMVFLTETRGIMLGGQNFQRRVVSGLTMIEAIVQTAADNAEEVYEVIEGARRKVIEGDEDIVISDSYTPENRTWDMIEVETGKLVKPSRGLRLPQAWKEAADRLRLVGVKVDQLRSEFKGEVEALNVTSITLGASVYHGTVLNTVTTETKRKEITMPAGSYWVSARQAAAAHAKLMENTPSTARKRSSVRRANHVPRVHVQAYPVYIKSLEDRVAELELALQGHGLDTESLAGNRVSQDTVEATPEPRQSTDLNLLSLFIPEPSDIQDQGTSGYHALLGAITVPERTKFPPKSTTLQLAATYFEHSNFFSPILYQESFHEIITVLYQDLPNIDQGKSVQKFQLCMVLAIAIRLLNRIDSAVPTTASDPFFASAIGILTERPQATWKGNLQHLQNLLLIVQYTIFASNLSAAWHFIGLATRLAIDLDLLNETRLSSGNSEEVILDAETNKRRRVFWSTYILETNLCVILNRPRSIPDEAVFTPLPSTSGPESCSPLANHCIQFRQLEYEIYHTLNYKPPANGAFFDYKVWKVGMKDRLVEWHATVPPVDTRSKLAPQNFFDGALYMTLVSLFSPSRHFPDLSEPELRDLARYASTTIELYREGFKEGKLRFYWRTTPNLFQSGAALVHCIKSLTLQRSVFDVDALKRSVSVCSTVLWGMAERYSPGTVYRDRFDELSASMSDVATDLSFEISDDFPFGQFSIPPLDLNGTAGIWTSTPPTLDPWIFDPT
ncbi:Carboxypeptidase 2 [Fusarium culmorum]|uniref:Carboxypeptidase 2 n=1 Tax=Fusarium culmorum TaxID=5516 RepID=A0A2T4GZL7_FUSCU|nr:Carboxypeptidase 2 [Fusarium culmorum]